MEQGKIKIKETQSLVTQLNTFSIFMYFLILLALSLEIGSKNDFGEWHENEVTKNWGLKIISHSLEEWDKMGKWEVVVTGSP